MGTNPCYPQTESCRTLCTMESERYGSILQIFLDRINSIVQSIICNHYAVHFHILASILILLDVMH